MNPNPTVGYSRRKGPASPFEIYQQLTQNCHYISDDFCVVQEPTFEGTHPRYVWQNVLRLMRAGNINTLVLFELKDAELDLNKFTAFLNFLKVKGIRLVSLCDGFDSNRDAIDLALDLFNQPHNSQKGP